MSKTQQIWNSLRDDEYRREYADDVGTGLAFQIKLIREKNGWTQQELADSVGSHQPTIHQWEDPDYGNHTLNSLKSLASAFDLGLMVKFVPFSELVHWNANLTPDRLAPPSFEEEAQAQYLPLQSYSEHIWAKHLAITGTTIYSPSVVTGVVVGAGETGTTLVEANAYPGDATVAWACGMATAKESEHALAA